MVKVNGWEVRTLINKRAEIYILRSDKARQMRISFEKASDSLVNISSGPADSLGIVEAKLDVL